jgi:hypothetical protein
MAARMPAASKQALRNWSAWRMLEEQKVRMGDLILVRFHDRQEAELGPVERPNPFPYSLQVKRQFAPPCERAPP